jgi:hypothetical protein
MALNRSGASRMSLKNGLSLSRSRRWRRIKSPEQAWRFFPPIDLISDRLPDKQAHRISQKHKSNQLLQVF